MKIILVIFVLIFAGCARFGQSTPLLQESLNKEKIYQAMKNYPDLIAINKERLIKNDTPKNRLALAWNYYQISDYQSALYYLEPLINEGKQAQAFLLKAKILDFLQDYESAIWNAKECLNLDPKNAEAYNLLGIVHAKKKDFEAAKENFLRAKSLFLADATINNNLALLAMFAQDYTSAINYLLPLYNRGLKSPQIVSNLVFSLVKDGQKHQALEIIEREKLAKNPSSFLQALEHME